VASPSTSDAFALLGLPVRFDVDLKQLERAYHETSKDVHPDRFVAAPAAERVAAISKFRALSDAYQLLRRDASRAEYLLALEGIVIGDNERIDPSLVMELLEEREVLAEARHKGDTAAVERLQASMQARRRAALDEIRALFAHAEHGEGKLAEIKQQLILLRYVERYLEECDNFLDEV
jgi:molecular chaperone HscB